MQGWCSPWGQWIWIASTVYPTQPYPLYLLDIRLFDPNKWICFGVLSLKIWGAETVKNSKVRKSTIDELIKPINNKSLLIQMQGSCSPFISERSYLIVWHVFLEVQGLSSQGTVWDSLWKSRSGYLVKVLPSCALGFAFGTSLSFRLPRDGTFSRYHPRLSTIWQTLVS